jgi:hypothetical protein
MSVKRIRREVMDDQGISLAELLVSFFISILLLTMVGGFFTAVVRGTQSSAVADANTRQMSTAMGTMVQYLHAATTYPVSTQPQPMPAFTNAGATDVTFYAYVNLASTAAQPVKVRYYLDSSTGNLIEQQWASTCSPTTGYCTFSTTVSKQINLGGPITPATPLNGVSTPLFTYFDSNDVATTTLSSIDYVGINLEWGSQSVGSAGDGHVSTVVGLLNLGQSGAQS